MKTTRQSKFDTLYAQHCKHLKLNGLRPKTIEAYARGIRRIGAYFNGRLEDLTHDEMLDYFHQLKETSSWSTVKLDLYGLKFFYTHVLKKNWNAIPLIKSPKVKRIPNILSVEEVNQFCHKALARVFRAKMLHALSCHGLNLPHAYPEDWVADCKHVGKGNKALVYLGQYLYRGVIKEKDILSCRDGKVTFRYKNSKMNAENSRSTNKYQTRTVSAVHFLWLVMQHVLPRGFRRARNFGFLHPNSKKMIRIIQWMFRLNVQKRTAKPRIKMKCPCCGHAMRVVDVLLPAGFRLPIPKPA